jgi:hypothetical protein
MMVAYLAWATILSSRQPALCCPLQRIKDKVCTPAQWSDFG